ncbi:MFS transporter [Streptomyces sp. NPDC017993]|uniref:MFS transporter n=1 Tax=Streptomyces sp. NPDC017993 TaxID=3365027 RepID=UPI0037B91B40
MSETIASGPVGSGHVDDQPRPGRWLALAVLVLAVLLVGVDVTVLGLATPFLSEDLQPSGAQLLWIGDIYSFVIAGLLVSMGSLGDRIGRKKLLLVGSTAFGAVSVLCAYASSPEMMIAARALLGVAGATLMPSTLALIRNLFHDPKERSLAVGIWGAMASAGTAVGPVLGGFLLGHFWWGSVFLINLPVMALLVVVGAKVIPESRRSDPGPWDIPSVLLSLVGIIAVVYAIKEVAVHGYRWDIALSAVLGVAALVWFVRRQLTLSSPLLDMKLFHHRGFSGAVLADLLTILGLSGLVFFLSQFLQMVQLRSPLDAGLTELPAAVGAVGAGLAAGYVARRLSVRIVVSGGLAVVGLSLAGCMTLHADTGTFALGTILFVVGIGAGFSFTVTADVILSSVPKEEAGAASGVSETAYELGAALGIALLGSIVTSIYRGFTVPPGLSPEATEAARESLGGAFEQAEDLSGAQGQMLIKAAQDSFVDGLDIAAGVGAAILLSAAVAAWFLLRGQELGTGRPKPAGKPEPGPQAESGSAAGDPSQRP